MAKELILRIETPLELIVLNFFWIQQNKYGSTNGLE